MQQQNKKFCLDTNCLIEAKNRYYAFDILPRFWELILECCDDGIILIPESVYEELKEGYKDEELLEWARQHKETLFIPLDPEIFQIVGSISNFVMQNFKQEKANIFLKGRDPEIISFAKHKNLILVTQEGRVNLNNSRDKDGKFNAGVKIPNICEFFDIEYMNLFDMLRMLKRDYGKKL